MIYLFSVSRKLIRIEIEKRTSYRFTHIKSASFFKQRSQHFYLFHIDHFSHPLPVEIGDQVSLVHKNFSVSALAGADGLDLALLDKLTDGVFGKSADECGTLLDSQHLHLVGDWCFSGLRSGVLHVLGELDKQLQNVVYDLFFLCCSHKLNLFLSMVCVLWILGFLHLLHLKKHKRCKRQIPLTENVRIDLNIGHGFVVSSPAVNTTNILVFFQHINRFVEVLSVLEQGASAKVVQVVLPYLRDTL